MRYKLGLIFIVIIFMIGIFTDAWRTAKTIWLIAQVTPYEQVGTGTSAPRILIVGDSTGYGTGAGSGDKSIAGLLGSDYPSYTVVNNSKNGRTINGALEAIKALSPYETYELILFQIGGNDILQKRPIDLVQSELQSLFAEAQKRGAKIVMVSCGNVGTAAAFLGTNEAALYDRLTREFRTMFISEAAASGVTYIDLFEESEVDVFALEPKKYLAIDGLHPSAAGYAFWYQSLRPEVAKILQ